MNQFMGGLLLRSKQCQLLEIQHPFVRYFLRTGAGQPSHGHHLTKVIHFVGQHQQDPGLVVACSKSRADFSLLWVMGVAGLLNGCMDPFCGGGETHTQVIG